MNENARKSIQTYGQQAGRLCAVYNGLNTVDVLPGIENVLKEATQGIGSPNFARGLDLGCGSGRDAFWAASRGVRMVAVDGSIDMIRQAWDTHQMPNITFIEDEIPTLQRIKNMGHSYNLYIMSAVWMHLDADERKKTIEFMDGMARRRAMAYITLRHGPSPEDRPMFETSVEEVQDMVAEVKGEVRVLPTVEDKLGRSDVTWDYVAVKFQPV